MAAAEIERLYMLRRDLLRLRNAAAPLVDVCRRLTSPDMPQVGPAMHSYFRDVTDHIRGVQEKIDNLREVLAFAFEASLLMGQNQANVVPKKLASWAAILAVPTAIAGVYGMNFKNMPELEMRGRLPPRRRRDAVDLRLPLLAVPPHRLALAARLRSVRRGVARLPAVAFPPQCG